MQITSRRNEISKEYYITNQGMDLKVDEYKKTCEIKDKDKVIWAYVRLG